MPTLLLQSAWPTAWPQPTPDPASHTPAPARRVVVALPCPALPCRSNHPSTHLFPVCRVVIVSSVTHRWGNLCSTPDRLRQEFLRGDFGHYYWNTKLANCMFGYELQRRLGGRGVQVRATCLQRKRVAAWLFHLQHD